MNPIPVDLLHAHEGDMRDIFDLQPRDQELAKSMSKPREIGENEEDDNSEFPKNVLLCFQDVCTLIEEEVKWLEENKCSVKEFNQFT